MAFTKELAQVLIARCYGEERLKSSYLWDIRNGASKKSLYPNSFELMELLEVTGWDEVIPLSEKFYNYYQNKLDIQNGNELKSHLHSLIHKKYIINTLKPYADKITNTKEYNALRNKLMEQGIELPSLQIIIYHFGKWNDFKAQFNLPTSSGTTSKYDHDSIIEILKKHGKELNTMNWVEKAKEKGLPSIMTVLKYISKDELEQYTQYKRESYTRAELLEVAWKHQEYFIQSIRKWNKYASENKYPSYYTFRNEFSKGELIEIKEVLRKDSVKLDAFVQQFSKEIQQ